jgi:GR25 family glycosyltransferase involved in LPS biosynthesis
MKAFVISMMDNTESLRVARRCIKSAAKFGVVMGHFSAITPKKEPVQLAASKGIPIEGFKEVYSRFENCLSAFLSHHTLWEKCVEDNEEYIICEHDAVFVNTIPLFLAYDKVISLGKPSYGKANLPQSLGVNPLTSKAYFPGAHAYMLKPSGAKELIDQAKFDAGPTDIFLHRDRFPWLQEYYPWPVEARDTFTTIQKTKGCLAKHYYNDEYKII